MCVSGSVLTGSENKAPSCLVHMVVELGIWNPPGPQPGPSWASLLLPAGDEGSSEHWVQRGIHRFILQNSLLTLQEGSLEPFEKHA